MAAGSGQFSQGGPGSVSDGQSGDYVYTLTDAVQEAWTLNWTYRSLSSGCPPRTDFGCPPCTDFDSVISDCLLCTDRVASTCVSLRVQVVTWLAFHSAREAEQGQFQENVDGDHNATIILQSSNKTHTKTVNFSLKPQVRKF